MLSAVKSYLRKKGIASLQEIALHLNSPEAAVEGMLQTLIRKGSVEERKLKAACGTSCASCDASTTRYYQLSREGAGTDQERPVSPPPGCRL